MWGEFALAYSALSRYFRAFCPVVQVDRKGVPFVRTVRSIRFIPAKTSPATITQQPTDLPGSSSSGLSTTTAGLPIDPTTSLHQHHSHHHTHQRHPASHHPHDKRLGGSPPDVQTSLQSFPSSTTLSSSSASSPSSSHTTIDSRHKWIVTTSQIQKAVSIISPLAAQTVLQLASVAQNDASMTHTSTNSNALFDDPYFFQQQQRSNNDTLSNTSNGATTATSAANAMTSTLHTAMLSRGLVNSAAVGMWLRLESMKHPPYGPSLPSQSSSQPYDFIHHDDQNDMMMNNRNLSTEKSNPAHAQEFDASTMTTSTPITRSPSERSPLHRFPSHSVDSTDTFVQRTATEQHTPSPNGRPSAISLAVAPTNSTASSTVSSAATTPAFPRYRNGVFGSTTTASHHRTTASQRLPPPPLPPFELFTQAELNGSGPKSSPIDRISRAVDYICQTIQREKTIARQQQQQYYRQQQYTDQEHELAHYRKEDLFHTTAASSSLPQSSYGATGPVPSSLHTTPTVTNSGLFDAFHASRLFQQQFNMQDIVSHCTTYDQTTTNPTHPTNHHINSRHQQQHHITVPSISSYTSSLMHYVVKYNLWDILLPDITVSSDTKLSLHTLSKSPFTASFLEQLTSGFSISQHANRGTSANNPNGNVSNNNNNNPANPANGKRPNHGVTWIPSHLGAKSTLLPIGNTQQTWNKYVEDSYDELRDMESESVNVFDSGMNPHNIQIARQWLQTRQHANPGQPSQAVINHHLDANATSENMSDDIWDDSHMF